ncbi:hypothetical protein GCM10029964_084600 [Kibdelosporangium lantanae]
MRTLRFHHAGEPLDVLRLEKAEQPRPAPGQIRVAVEVCTINPADLALCRGLYPGSLPRGVGLEVAGTVDAIGDDVTGVQPGDEVFGPTPFTGPTAGASDHALLDIWFPRPPVLQPAAAAALPMAVDTAQTRPGPTPHHPRHNPAGQRRRHHHRLRRRATRPPDRGAGAHHRRPHPHRSPAGHRS